MSWRADEAGCDDVDADEAVCDIDDFAADPDDTTVFVLLDDVKVALEVAFCPDVSEDEEAMNEEGATDETFYQRIQIRSEGSYEYL